MSRRISIEEITDYLLSVSSSVEIFSRDLNRSFRHGCGNNVHVKCMKIWLEHQVSTGEKMVKCPLCRETFGTPEQLKQEFR